MTTSRSLNVSHLLNPPIVGYASLFDVPDQGSDVVAPGAFAASLARRGPSGVRMLWRHDPARPLGQWRVIEEDALGLRVEGRLDLGLQNGREVAGLVRIGALDGLSIGFRVKRAEPTRGGRRLLELDLWEISLVENPLHPGALLTRKRGLPTPAPQPEISARAA